MQQTVNVRRSDLFRLNAFFLPRLRGTWVYVAVLTAAGFAYLSIFKGVDDTRALSLAALLAVFGGLGAAMIMTAVATLSNVARASIVAGTLGEHSYGLNENGVHESTQISQTLYRWQKVDSLLRTQSHMFVQIGDRYLVIPRREFSSVQGFDRFCQEAQRLWNRARSH